MSAPEKTSYAVDGMMHEPKKSRTPSAKKFVNVFTRHTTGIASDDFALLRATDTNFESNTAAEEWCAENPIEGSDYYLCRMEAKLTPVIQNVRKVSFKR